MSSDIAMDFSLRNSKAYADAARRHLPLVLTVLVVLLLAYELAGLTWRWMQGPAQVQALPPPAADTAAAPAKQADATRVVAAHLFGQAEATPGGNEEVLAAPETRLNLELRGVFATGDQTGAAVIADASRQEHYYRIGESVAGEAKLHEVHPDRVILERGGRYEALTLPKQPLPGSGTGQPSQAPGAPAPSAAPAANTSETRQMLQQYRQTLINEPKQLMNLVRFTPVTKGSQTIGYRLSPGADRTLLARFGLRNGDVVTAVNGLPVDGASGGVDIIQKLASAEQLVLQVERDGVPQTFTFQINE